MLIFSKEESRIRIDLDDGANERDASVGGPRPELRCLGPNPSIKLVYSDLTTWQEKQSY